MGLLSVHILLKNVKLCLLYYLDWLITIEVALGRQISSRLVRV